ncbi:MAG: hypothetical protein VYD19_08815 [Myxococcota bacterium]|nr:hypothetical protein [Myxococcota bacterium]
MEQVTMTKRAEERPEQRDPPLKGVDPKLWRPAPPSARGRRGPRGGGPKISELVGARPMAPRSVDDVVEALSQGEQRFFHSLWGELSDQVEGLALYSKSGARNSHHPPPAQHVTQEETKRETPKNKRRTQGRDRQQPLIHREAPSLSPPSIATKQPPHEATLDPNARGPSAQQGERMEAPSPVSEAAMRQAEEREGSLLEKGALVEWVRELDHREQARLHLALQRCSAERFEGYIFQLLTAWGYHSLEALERPRPGCLFLRGSRADERVIALIAQLTAPIPEALPLTLLDLLPQFQATRALLLSTGEMSEGGRGIINRFPHTLSSLTGAQVAAACYQERIGLRRESIELYQLEPELSRLLVGQSHDARERR